MSIVLPNIEIEEILRSDRFSWKDACFAASFADTNWTTTVSLAFVDPTLTISNLPTGTTLGLLDGVEPTTDDRVLIKDAGAAGGAGGAEDDGFNGIWKVTGGTTTSLTLVRPYDQQVGDNPLGASTWVLRGTQQGLSSWVCESDTTITNANTNDLTFTQWDVRGVLPISRGGTGTSSLTPGSRIVQTNAGATALETTTTPVATQILDTNNNELLIFVPAGSAVNEFTIENASSGNDPIFRASGEANIGIQFLDSNSNELVLMNSVASAVNHFETTNSATGVAPTFQSAGEANIGINFTDSNNHELLLLNSVASAVNQLEITNSATGNAPIVSAGGEADIGILFNDSNGNELLTLEAVASAVNDILITNASTGVAPTIRSNGEVNTGLIISDSNNNELVIFDSNSTAVNELTIANASTGNAPIISTTGGDANIDLEFNTAGTGSFVFGAGDTSTSAELRMEDNTGGEYGAWTVPATVTTSFSLILPDGVGTSGQMLTTDGNNPAQLSWTTPSTSAQYITLATLQITASNASDVEVAQFAWDDSEYSTFSSRTIIFWYEDVTNRDLILEVFDVSGSSSLGTTTISNPAADAIGTFTFTAPGADARLAIRISKSANGGTNPKVYGITLRLA